MRKILIGILLGLSLGISFSLFAWVNPSQNPPSGGGVLQTSNTGLTINTSTYFISGNVGIGTTAPSQKLHVAGGSAVIGYIAGFSGGVFIAAPAAYGQPAIQGVTSAFTPETLIINPVGGNVGIGTTTPVQKLHVEGNTYISGNVGIGTTTPDGKLDILGSTADRRLKIGYGGDNPHHIVSYRDLVLNSNGGFYIRHNPTAGNPADFIDLVRITSSGNVGIGTTAPKGKLAVSFNNDDEIVMYSSGDNRLAIQTTLDGQPLGTYGGGENRLALQPLVGVVGIGTLNPVYKLDVASNGSYTARFGTSSSDTVVIGGGAGKLTVGTLDPVYSIGGKKYATYGPESIGVKVGHTGVLKLVLNKNKYEGALDFKNAKEGDDLWLFAKTTNLASNFDKLTIQLTPAFKGKVWYNKDKENMIVKIYGEADELNNNELEVSYSLSAPRFDFEKWPNYSNDETVEGIKIY